MKCHKIQEISDLLLNEEKTKAFKRAISRVVKPGDIVLDISSSAGLMAMLTVREGARKVFLLAQDKDIYDQTYNNINSANVTLINTVQGLQDKIDVVIFGLFDAMLISNQQVKLANHLIKQGVITTKTKTTPRRIHNFFELTSYDYDFLGCNLPMIISAENASSHHFKSLGSSVQYNEIHLKEKTPLHCKYEGRHIVHTQGWLNALKFSTVMCLSDDLFLGANKTTYIPIKERVVKPGDMFDVSLNYQIGGDYGTLSIFINPSQ